MADVRKHVLLLPAGSSAGGELVLRGQMASSRDSSAEAPCWEDTPAHTYVVFRHERNGHSIGCGNPQRQ